MIMTEDEIQKVVKAADFLNDKGYAREIGEFTISFLGEKINFIISFERYGNVSDILIILHNAEYCLMQSYN